MKRKKEKEPSEDSNEETHTPPEPEKTPTSLEALELRHITELKVLLQRGCDAIKQDNAERVDIEIEARFGIYSFARSTSKFRPGICESEFQALKDYLDGLENFNEYFDEHEDYIFPNPIKEVKGSYRVNFEEGSQTKFASGQIKSQIEEVKLVFGKLMPYDVRVTLSKEIDMFPSKSLNTKHYRLCRKKERWSYEQDELPFRIDLTKVTSTKPNNNSNPNHNSNKVTFEAEFEILSSKLAVFIENEDQITKTVNEFYKTIITILKVVDTGQKIFAEIPTSPFSELEMVPVLDDTLLSRLKCTLAKAVGQTDIKEFPGSMPVTFSRSHFPVLQSKKYFVSEKTDGMRYLLLISSDGVHLIDRKLFFFRVHDYDSLVNVLAPDDTVTLLDGELVRNNTTMEVIFLLFDALQVAGDNCIGRLLNERLTILGQNVVLPYRKAVEDKVINAKHPFVLIGKNFYQKRDLPTLFSCIKQDSHGERYYMDLPDKKAPDKPPKRHHKTDGLIFAPDEAYCFKTTHNLFKWKFVDKQSVDFRAKKLPSDKFILFCQVQGGETQCFEVSFNDEDLNRLKEDFKKYKKKDDAIIECTYDPWTGTWCYSTLRPDKKTPNYIRIVFDTLMAIAEGITREEISYRLQFEPHQDDWVLKQNNHKKGN